MTHPASAGDARSVANMELVGGRPVVDFVNTVSDRSTGTPFDRLRGFDDLVEWCVRVELFGPEAARLLRDAAGARPGEALAALQRARELREALFELFAAEVEDREPPGPALETFNAFLAEGLRHRRLETADGEFRWRWAEETDRLDWMLGPLASSAAELLTGDELGRLKQCAQGDCRWIFLDLSKNRSRRWCTMEDCGNRAKARRHYHRHKSAGNPS